MICNILQETFNKIEQIGRRSKGHPKTPYSPRSWNSHKNGGKMTREEKRKNKEHCKNLPFGIRLQCWWFRNLDLIVPILVSVLTSFVTGIALTLLEMILQ